MAQPKLAKLTRPRTEGLLRRERLFALLDEVRAQSLIWIVAPPGAGKTSLISSYLEVRKVPTLWYQLDGGDADPASFFYYLGLAAMEFMPANIKSLPLFTQEFAADVVGFARRFFRELYAVLPDGAMLVLDNYQEVPERSQLHALIDTALAELPDARLICGISRSDVPSELARWRAAQRVMVMDFQALKLNADEAIRIGRAHSDLDDSALKALHGQTDGWAAGLILMAERLRQTGQMHQGARSTNLETVFDYFAGQILNALPEAIRRLLIRMSYLPRLTAETAQAITGDPEAVRVLTDLAKRNLFTDRRYGEDVSFQFHALFRAFLQEQASEQLGASEHRKVAHSAAALLQATGQVEDAFLLFAGVGAWDSSAALVRKQADRLVRQGRRQTLRQWIGMLPMGSIEQDAWLLYWLGVCSLGVDHEKAHELLTTAFDRFADDADDEGRVISASTAAESYFSMRVGWNGLDVWIDRLAQLLLRDEPTVSESTLVRGTIALARSMFYRQTERRELGRLIEILTGYLSESRDPNERVAAAAIVVGYNWMYGNGDVCDRVVATVEPFVDDPAVTASNRSFFYFWWICLEYSQGNLEESTLLVGRAKQVWDELGLSPMAIEFERLGTVVQILQGDYRKAREILETKVAPFMNSARPVARSFYHIHMATCDLGEGQPAGARKHLDEAMTVVRTLGYTLADVMNNHLTGLVLAAEGRFDEADRSLLEHRDRMRRWGNRTVESFTTACRALVLLRRGSTEAALAELRASLSAIEGGQCLWAHHISVSLLAELFALRARQ
ncbi:MAG: hypothetical protein KIS79_08290 [Burkholderiales bacterium]|nr:hypothetical protein [Burkholderiales bacterium]